jgi:quercetin dioxygenase-like cupin family protein
MDAARDAWKSAAQVQPFMTRKLLPLVVMTSLSWACGASNNAHAQGAPIRVQQLLQATCSWDGTRYTAYPGGQPQVSMLKITIPPHTALRWHEHPMINAGYVLSGEIVVERKDTGVRKVFRAGQALAESVNAVHRGYTADQPAELVVFYAGAVGLPLSIKAKSPRAIGSGTAFYLDRGFAERQKP